ncbi:MAG: CBS domain-containing protein [Candidatus Mycalebacterium zealandia]|nr:MAG: CBS domain-containing protein [Candidatus Mycalebacterium zealandia]
MLLSEIMTTPVATISEEASLKDVADTMKEKSVGCLPVVDGGGKLTGIISETDFIGAMENVPFSRQTGHVLFGKWTDGSGIVDACREGGGLKLKDFMQTRVITVEESDTVEDAVTKMLETRVHRLPVVRDEKPVAMFSRRDLLKIFE